MGQLVRVVAAIIWCENKLLVTKRKPAGSAGGMWEFPGGKVRNGESDEAALYREIREELSIEIEIGHHFITRKHKYPEKTIDLACYIATFRKGSIKLTDHDDFQWCAPGDLCGLTFAPADRPVVERLLDEGGSG